MARSKLKETALEELGMLEQIAEQRAQTAEEKLKAFNLRLEIQQIGIAEFLHGDKNLDVYG